MRFDAWPIRRAADRGSSLPRLLFPILALTLAAWTEPPRSLRPEPFACARPRALDGDTLQCRGGTRVRLRGVDTPERGEPRYREATRELQRRLRGCQVKVVPHHRSYDRIVGDVLACGVNVGQAMDAAGWSKPTGARR